jgi:hypothetical protein
MKSLYIILSLLLFSAVYGGAFLEYFHTRTDSDNNVVIEWKTAEEVNLRNFVIERKSPQSSYMEIAVIEPEGDNSFYSYEDETAYKGNDLFFTYRLKIVDTSNNISYSAESSVSTKPSDIKRTWGSIKAMFR